VNKRFFLVFASLLLAACSQTPEPADVAGKPVTGPSQNVWSVAQLPSTSLTVWNTSDEVNARDLDKPVVINLWASWCSACAHEMPLIADSEFASHVVAINVGDLAVSSSGMASASALVASTHAAFPIYIDSKDTLMKALKVNGLPVTFAVDKNNKIVDYEFGELTNETLARLVQASGS
jgi:thiol-disulfide isomerase/thioredoxin